MSNHAKQLEKASELLREAYTLIQEYTYQTEDLHWTWAKPLADLVRRVDRRIEKLQDKK